MSIHSIQIDQSMQNWQVSGGSAYWFRCIPNRFGCIATFLISKTPSCTWHVTVKVFDEANTRQTVGGSIGSINSIGVIGVIGSIGMSPPCSLRTL